MYDILSIEMDRAKASTMPKPSDGPLITKAFLRAATILGFNQKEMADILGKSEPTISRLAARTLALSPIGKDGEICLLFLRMYRSLNALLGGSETNMVKWFNAFNYALDGIPREQVKTFQGLMHVTEYLDAMRGKM